ncbi:hypothetical protein CPB85DRAFT_1435066 [Mucidula mucida]|nr:hypothetical protein CPB85DRAFT_1435066 [Mucidula mucida]
MPREEPPVKEPSASSATATNAKGLGEENTSTPSKETATPVPQTDTATPDATTSSPSQDTNSNSSPPADAALIEPDVNSEQPQVPKLTIDTSTQWPNNLLGVFVPSVSTSQDTKSHSSLTTPQDLANTTAAAADANEGSTEGAATNVNVDESVAKVVDSDVDEPPFVDAEQFHLTSSEDGDDSDSDSGFHSTSEDQPQTDAPQIEDTRV